VTRPGYDHCDVTDGVLLDITPLLVDGRKVVTLYDKDLAEGINLLIGKWDVNYQDGCLVGHCEALHSLDNRGSKPL
jgi:hypothetical protein